MNQMVQWRANQLVHHVRGTPRMKPIRVSTVIRRPELGIARDTGHVTADVARKG